MLLKTHQEEFPYKSFHHSQLQTGPSLTLMLTLKTVFFLLQLCCNVIVFIRIQNLMLKYVYSLMLYDMGGEGVGALVYCIILLFHAQGEVYRSILIGVHYKLQQFNQILIECKFKVEVIAMFSTNPIDVCFKFTHAHNFCSGLLSSKT